MHQPQQSQSQSSSSSQSKTTAVYSAIQQHNYADAITLLTHERATHPTSRACLSLLAYCQYHAANYGEAAMNYAELSLLFPDVVEYRL